MNRPQLKARLVREGFESDVYGIDGDQPAYEGLVLARAGAGWRIDHVERGRRSPLQLFATEERACQRMYELLCAYFQRLPPTVREGQRG